jgi:cytochrome c553
MHKFLVIVVLVAFHSVCFGNPNIEKGQKLFTKCASCHGKDGYGKAGQKAPMLAGQYSWYVVSQVKAIKSGIRKNNNTKKMMPFVKKLTDDEILALGNYIESLPKKK